MISEDALHKQVAEYLNLILPLGAMFQSHLQEGKRGFVYQRKLKDFGCKAGWPDIQILQHGRSYFIELKRPSCRINGKLSRKGYLSGAQESLFPILEDCGASIAVCRSLEEVETALQAWGIMEKAGQ